VVERARLEQLYLLNCIVKLNLQNLRTCETVIVKLCETNVNGQARYLRVRAKLKIVFNYGGGGGGDECILWLSVLSSADQESDPEAEASTEAERVSKLVRRQSLPPDQIRGRIIR
jgi:hypothetical protein